MAEPSVESLAPRIDLLTIGEDSDWIIAFGHVPLIDFALAAYDYARYELDIFDTDEARQACAASRHRYARPPTLDDFAEYADDPDEQRRVLERALEEDWMMWTDEPTDRPVTLTGRLT